ncbi:putative UBIQUINONE BIOSYNTHESIS PROTEIN AARF [Vibrio nigripulchritudo SO65]|uniref:ABC1 kinase family protein n=1 Tax=Vibrio nigripulchritudo TaxID=28173 RepID=UPI0003B1D13E|nr:AarF/ABC1/UbiB kinase family protein [Vibrio nigripulchritudo]CCN36843.1 putative UBIQUINONE BIOSYNTHESIS PROTEIN AARF [Vibrio nigripulchritudo AM115]CCN44619.1 putative UBIQUINONE BIOSYNTHESIS PROTEIN AARF [Vibrio nigripulchritudo FTn2]CCN66519.1 putative UBIQUINONE BIOSYNTHESIS PROTEIN AARF [Vibrio nigripulchritudo POn4]CCN76215.1 putative UBIQUINONE BIOSYNTHESIS PROTEIN AARF [Vibrio nigripulchritudo SO65]
MTDIPTGKIGRSSVVVQAVVRAGSKKVSQKAKKLIGLNNASDTSSDELVDQEVAEILFKALTKLRGTGLKVAQMLCMNQVHVPESIRKELGKSCYQVPGINRALVRKIIHSQFGQYPETLFASFENTPFAAASLGQVHLAKDHNGNRLAVKIQYPGIDQTIRSDMTTLRQLLKLLPSEYNFKQSLPYIEKSLLEEVDYLHELEQTHFFSSMKIDGVGVVNPVEEFCTAKVLTTHFVEGMHLDEWLATQPSQNNINLVCQRLLTLFLETLRSGQRFHSDPNIGNFLISENQTIQLLDFGSTFPIDRETADGFLSMLKAYQSQNLSEVKKWVGHFYLSGVNTERLNGFEERFKEFVAWKSKLLSDKGFCFKSNPGYMEQGMTIAFHAHHDEKMPFNPRGDVLFYERVLYGYLQIFQRANAQITFQL